MIRRVIHSIPLLFLVNFTGLTQSFQYQGDGRGSGMIMDTIPGSVENTAFYDSLRNRAYKNLITRELHNIIVLPSRKPDPDAMNSERITDNYLPFEGKTIREIRFVRLEPFGSSFYDTAWTSGSRLAKYGNAIHFKTLERVLMRHMILKPGDPVDPNLVADNERLLRELKYIEDVRIMIEEDSLDSGMADLVVITRDVWSKAFFIELKELNAGKLALWDRNIFGTGNDFENNIHWDPDKSDFWGYDAIYKTRNILGSFINSSIYYKNIFETESYGLSFERKFFTPGIKYAGGFQTSKTRTTEQIWYSPELQVKEALAWSLTDVWMGRSFLLNPGSKGQNERMNIILASRLIKNHYTSRPDTVSENLFFEFHNNLIWLNSISYTAQGYYRSNLIYSFGRTEDIPYGWLAKIIIGKEFSEFNDRMYTAFRLAHGNYLSNFGYAYASVAAGSFLNQDGSYSQGVTELKMNYFTNLFIFGRFKFRQFVSFSHVRGINRFDLERININDANGVRGLHARGVFGQQRLNINLESVLFSPANFYGFRFSLFGFYDFSLLGAQNDKLSQLDDYNGVGFGIRIRNERLVFPTLQFRFAFYPGFESLSPVDYFHFSGEKKLNPEDFTSGAPQFIKF